MREKEKSATGLKVTVKPLGPTREELMATGERALTLASVRKFIGRGRRAAFAPRSTTTRTTARS